MSFLDEEESVESGQPLELYHFSVGTEDFYYTSAEDIITFAAQPYLPKPISRNSPEQSLEAGKSKLEIVLPTDDEVCIRYIGIVQPEPMTVTVTRFHRADLLDGLVIWQGRVIQAVYTKQGSQCKLTVVASESVFSRSVPQYKYQGLCNHILYDDNCALDEDDFKFEGDVTGAVGNNITVVGLVGGGRADGWALGGKVVFGNDARLVVEQVGDTLHLSQPFKIDPGGQDVAVHAGCDHTLATCVTKFSNNINFGGFPFVPTKNPFASGVN